MPHGPRVHTRVYYFGQLFLSRHEVIRERERERKQEERKEQGTRQRGSKKNYLMQVLSTRGGWTTYSVCTFATCEGVHFIK
jgi:hypothetical protein